MYVKRHKVAITTAADGTATGYTPLLMGRILSIQYVKTDFADTADFAITAEDTGQGLWTEENVTASAQVAPRQPTHDNAGAASLYAAGGEPVEDCYYLADERVKIAIAQGGDTKSGTFYVTVG